MFWKKKIQNPKRDTLSFLENSILQYLISELAQPYSLLVEKQLKYLVFINRIDYKNFKTTELYPEKYGCIPDCILFKRTEEFKLARIKFEMDGKVFNCEIHTALGQIFDIKIYPKPINIDKPMIEFKKIIIEPQLENNIY